MSGPVDRAAMAGPSVRDRRPAAAVARSAAPLLRHADFVTWQPPEEENDDLPILGDVSEGGARRGSLGEVRREVEGGFGEDRRAEGAEVPEGDLVEIYVNVGRRDGARASDFQRVLEERAGISRSGVQRIRVRERNAFVSVRKDDLPKALAALEGATIAGRTVTAEQARERS